MSLFLQHILTTKQEKVIIIVIQCLATLNHNKRVEIAKALAMVLADKPTGTLDRTNSTKTIDILLSAAHDQKCCVVVVTHAPTIGERADALLTMKDGHFSQA